MKVWHITCDVCKRPGPEHEDPIESIRLAEDQGWGPIERGIVRLTVCPECRAEPAASFTIFFNAPLANPRVAQSSLP